MGASGSDARTKRDADRPLRIVHAGHLVHGRAKLLRAVLGGAERYTRETGRDVKVVLMGEAPDDVERELGRVELEGRLEVLDWLPRAKAIRGRDLPDPPVQFSESDTVRAFADVLRAVVLQSP